MNTPNMHAVVIRGILIVAMSMALCVAVIHRAYTQPQYSPGRPMLARASIGQPAPVVLPTISVRPTAADIAMALESENDEMTAAFIEAAEVQTLSSHATLPGLHLDMPYYSFGKALPRVSKE
jgi:hypothetical protein